MLQRALLNKTLPCLSHLLRQGCINNFCSSSRKTCDEESSTSKQSADVSTESSVEDSRSTEDVSRLLDESATFIDANDTSWATTPYPKDVPIPTAEAQQAKKIDPKDRCVVIFPGQGILKVGKVEQYLRFPNAKELFEIANEILGYDLLKICLKGPQEKLDRTQFNQPAIVVSSLAALERLREERPRVFETCNATAGYSVGELTSLIFSGAISFEDGVRLVSVRALAMQNAASMSRQGMLSVFCTPQAKVSEACADAKKWAQDLGVHNPVCGIAIYLHTQGKILAGSDEALQYIESHSRKYGLMRLKRLPVSGAFHTSLMEPALQPFKKLLHTIEVDLPRCEVYNNYKATTYNTPTIIKKFLLKQIVAPVKWEQIMHTLYKRPVDTQFPRTFDVCSGGNMMAILKLVNAKAAESCIAL